MSFNLTNDQGLAEASGENDYFSIFAGMLSGWLSVAESQICALEVLSEQLPKVNTLLEDNMLSLSNSFSTLAVEAQNQSKNITEIIGSATSLTIAGEQTSLSDALKGLQKSIGECEGGFPAIEKSLDDIVVAVDNQQGSMLSAIESAEVSSEKMVGAISGAIVGMQFQDRVSQNLVITENVLRETVLYLKSSIDNTLSMFLSNPVIKNTKYDYGLDKDFAKKMLELLNLGELQGQFVDHLIEHGYIENIEQLGLTGNFEAEEEDDVELF